MSRAMLVRSTLVMIAVVLACACVRHATDPPPRPTFHLAVAGVPGGKVTSVPPGISCGTVCTAEFARGTVVTLRARPFPGVDMAGWGGACRGKTLCSLSVVRDERVTVRFVHAGTNVDMPPGSDPPSDLDHDGVPDDRDQCPVEPAADATGDGCPR